MCVQKEHTRAHTLSHSHTHTHTHSRCTVPTVFPFPRFQRIPTITPVVVKQVKEAQRNGEGGFAINGQAVDKVVLVAAIRRTEIKQTRVAYQVEDHTGLMDVTQFLQGGEEGEETEIPADIAENRYTRLSAAM